MSLHNIRMEPAQSTTLRELLEQRDRLDAEIAAKRLDERPDALLKALELVRDYGLTADELGLIVTQRLAPGRKGAATFPPKEKRGPVEPKYIDPETGATWSGRGKPPRWMGEDRDAYLIKV